MPLQKLQRARAEADHGSGGLQAAFARGKGDRRPPGDGRGQAAARLGHGRDARLRDAARRRATACACPARTSVAARSRTATRCCTTRTARTGTPARTCRCSTSSRQQPSFEIIDSVLTEQAVRGLRVRLFDVRPDAARDLGSAVRRFRQRRAGDHRPVHQRRRSQVGPDLRAGACCCRTATKARVPSIRRRARSASCSCARSTTCRCACRPRRRRSSTCCAGRCCANTASR